MPCNTRGGMCGDHGVCRGTIIPGWSAEADILVCMLGSCEDVCERYVGPCV